MGPGLIRDGCPGGVRGGGEGPALRIGIDLGGTKIEGAAFLPDGRQLLRRRVPTPTTSYADALAALADSSRSAKGKALRARAVVPLVGRLEDPNAGVRLAAVTVNLERLMHEYERTERRVRALEKLILPEIRSELTMMEEHLDLSEQEEVIRVRSIRRRDQTL